MDISWILSQLIHIFSVEVNVFLLREKKININTISRVFTPLTKYEVIKLL